MMYASDILLYSFIFILSSIFAFIGLKKYKTNRFISIILIAIGILIPSIMAGIRYDVGVDYFSYLKMYNNVVNGSEMYFRSIEPAGAFLITLSANLGNPVILFFSFSFITNLCLFLSFNKLLNRDAKYVALAYLISLFIMFPLSLNVIRSAAAASVTLLAISSLIKSKRRNIIKFLILLFLAFLFHKTSIIALLFLPSFILSKKQGKKYLKPKIFLLTLWCIIALFTPVLYGITKNIIDYGEYSRYLGEIGDAFSIPIANIILIIPIAVGYLYLRKNRDKIEFEQEGQNYSSVLYCSSYYLPLSIVVGWLTLVGIGGLSRLSLLVETLVYCLMSYILLMMDKTSSKNKKTLVAIIFVIVTVSLFVRNLNWSQALPYKTVYQEEIVYERKN